MICGCGALAAAGWLGGCASGGRAQPEPGSAPGTPGAAARGARPQPLPRGVISAATLTVFIESDGRIGASFAGLSYEKAYLAVPCFTPDNERLLGLFRRLGPSLLRVGGDSVDRVLWTPGGSGRSRGQVAPADVEALAGFLDGCAWRVLYGVNLATSTPAAAADEVAYAVHALGASLYGIELGNEPDLYTGGYFAHFTLADFEQRWQRFRGAIIARTPGVTFTGPADAGHVSDWTVPFGVHTGGQIALLTQHHYRGSGRSPLATITTLLSPDSALADELAVLGQATTRSGVPYRLAETNSFFGGGAPHVSDRYAAALWVIDLLFGIAQAGGAGANLHGGGGGYTPIADSDGAVIGPRPLYYGMLLFTLAGEGTLRRCSLATEVTGVSAYALERTDGALSVVVVNKDATHNLSLSIDCGRAVAQASLVALTGPAADALSGVCIQGSEVGADGAFSPQPPYRLPHSGRLVHCYVAALSAALIRVN